MSLVQFLILFYLPPPVLVETLFFHTNRSACYRILKCVYESQSMQREQYTEQLVTITWCFKWKNLVLGPTLDYLFISNKDLGCSPLTVGSVNVFPGRNGRDWAISVSGHTELQLLCSDCYFLKARNYRNRARGTNLHFDLQCNAKRACRRQRSKVTFDSGNHSCNPVSVEERMAFGAKVRVLVEFNE